MRAFSSTRFTSCSVRDRTTLPGTPRTREPVGMTAFSVTSAPAPMMQRRSITAPLRTVARMAIRTSSSTRAPCTTAPGARTQIQMIGHPAVAIVDLDARIQQREGIEELLDLPVDVRHRPECPTEKRRPEPSIPMLPREGPTQGENHLGVFGGDPLHLQGNVRVGGIQQGIHVQNGVARMAENGSLQPMMP